MSKYEMVTQETTLDVTGLPSEQPETTFASHASEILSTSQMFKFRESIRFYYPLLLIYNLAAFGIAGWALTGLSDSTGTRVLPTGNLKVEQLYSGLALSALLTPAAILIRKASTDLGLLHPFAIAAQQHITTGDLDRVIDGGLSAIPTIAKYSIWRALVQGLLMAAGAVLVPIGTLIVTTGPYMPLTASRGVVGMPTLNPDGRSMHTEMNLDGDDGYYSVGDYFLALADDAFKGRIIADSGILAPIEKTLGPISTANLSFDTGVEYNGIVTFNWDDGCELANTEIGYSVYSVNASGGLEIWANFTFPDKSVVDQEIDDGPFPTMWSRYQPPDDTTSANSSGAIGATTYYAMACVSEFTATWPSDNSSLTFADTDDGPAWISRVKCTPTLNWEISNCIWNGTSMQNCTPAPGTNTSALDTLALDTISGYMTTLPLKVMNDSDVYIFGNNALTTALTYSTEVGQFRAPGLSDYRNVYGQMATTLSNLATMGYYGTAEVQTVGGVQRPVYIARMYILALVIAIFSLVSILIAADIIYNLFHKLPFRKTSFLTIAAAVRGPWWDYQFQGASTASEKVLRHHGNASVRFGVDLDPDGQNRIGLAPKAREIQARRSSRS